MSDMIKSRRGIEYSLSDALRRNPTLIRAGDDICAVAADRIAALEAENERLRKALTPMMKGLFWLNSEHVADARAALQENDNG